MNEPVRLRDVQGPAAALLRGAALEVPSAARQRALTFASTVAAGVVATSTATAAGATSLAKSFLVYLALGTAGGGALSLAATQIVAGLEAPQPAVITPARQAPVRARAQAQPPPAVTAEPAPVASPVEASDESAAGMVVVPPRAAASDVRRAAPVSLFEEQRAIEKARLAISRGDAAAGLALLDDYERSYARRQFGPEALALRVEALRHQGHLAAARARAGEFERRYPRHPLLARVRELSR